MSAPLPIRVLTIEEAEQATYVVCMRAGSPSPFTDNAFGTCAHCRFPIFFRPHVPHSPMKICLECGGDLARGGRA